MKGASVALLMLAMATAIAGEDPGKVSQSPGAEPGTRVPLDKPRETPGNAERGIAEARFTLGTVQIDGKDVPKDEAQAVLRKAADEGNPLAQLALGILYASGSGGTEDDALAAQWLRKPAEQGDATAQYALGLLYADGRGVTKDEAQAAQWFRKAADQGYYPARKKPELIR